MSNIHALLREIVMQLSVYIGRAKSMPLTNLLCCTKILKSVANGPESVFLSLYPS